MIWTIVIIVIVILVSFFGDWKKQSINLRLVGGMENKYRDLIADIVAISDNFNWEERASNPVYTHKIDDNVIIIKINFSWGKSLYHLAESFKLTEVFGSLKIEWLCIEQPKTDLLGSELKQYNLNWTFRNQNAQTEIFEKIVSDINLFYRSRKQDRSYYKNIVQQFYENTSREMEPADSLESSSNHKVKEAKNLERQSYTFEDSTRDYTGLLLDETLRKGDFDNLIAISNQCIVDYPDWFCGYYYLGLANAATNKLKEALVNFNKSIELNPNYCDAFRKRADARRLLGDLTGAIDDYTHSAIVDPSSAALMYSSIGAIKAISKDYETALGYCNKAIELDPNFAKAYGNRGCTYSQMKNYDAAIKDFDKALSITPYIDSYYNKALTEMKMGKDADAIQGFSGVIKSDLKCFDAYYHRGVLYAKSHKHEEAILDFTKTIELKSTHASAYMNRGYSKQALNSIEAACNDWKKAGSLGIKDAYRLLWKYCFKKYDFINSSVESNNKIRDTVVYFLDNIGENSSFEELVRHTVKVKNVDTAVELYSKLQFGWENSGHTPADYEKIYFKVFCEG